MINWFEYQGRKYVEITGPDGVFVLTPKEFKTAVERTKQMKGG